MNEYMDFCHKGNHDLLGVFYRDSGPGCEIIVRWCRVCGAIVIDEDYDGRTNPGSVMKMRFPEIAKQLGTTGIIDLTRVETKNKEK